MGTRWANARWAVERWGEPFQAPPPDPTISVLWRNVRWGTSRWAQRGISLPGASLTINDRLVTVCRAVARIQGGEADVAGEYVLGNVVRIEGTFENDGIPIDPSNVIGSIKTPSGVYEYYSLGDNLVRDALGSFHFTVLASEEGRYNYRIASAGSDISAAEGFFIVRESYFN